MIVIRTTVPSPSWCRQIRLNTRQPSILETWHHQIPWRPPCHHLCPNMHHSACQCQLPLLLRLALLLHHSCTLSCHPNCMITLCIGVSTYPIMLLLSLPLLQRPLLPPCRFPCRRSSGSLSSPSSLSSSHLRSRNRSSRWDRQLFLHRPQRRQHLLIPRITSLILDALPCRPFHFHLSVQ